jgi:AcrR family transcriptional regulator
VAFPKGERLPSQEKILRVAVRMLVERGHEALSLRAVARRARFAPSTLYEHFADRDALLEAVARRALDDLFADIGAACAAGVPSRERLPRAATAYLSFATTRSNEFRLCFSRVQPAERTVPPATSPLMPVVTEIARGLAAGEYVAPSGFDALDMAIALWTQVHGIAVLRLAYLSAIPGVDDKAALIVGATIAAWRATPPKDGPAR